MDRVSSDCCPRHRYLLCGLLAGLSLTVVPGLAGAADFNAGAGLKATAKQDDNPLLTRPRSGQVRIRMYEPSVSVSGETDRLEASLVARLRAERSNDQQLSEDRDDLAFLFDSNYAFERASLRFNLDFEQASTRVTEFEESGQVTADGTRETYRYGGAYFYELTERNDLDLNFQRERVNYSDVNLTEYRSTSFGTGLRHAYRPNVEFSGNLSARFFRPDDPAAQEADLWSLRYGLQQEVSPLLHFSLSTGWTRIERDGDERSPWEIETSLQGHDELHHYDLSFARTNGSSGLGQISETERLDLGFSRELSDYVSAGIEGTMRKSSTDINGETRQRSLEPYLGFEISPSLNLRALYQLRRLKRGTTSGWAESNALMFSLEYDWQTR